VLLDTSGSISHDDLHCALTEIGGICTDLAIEVRVIVIDAAIHADVRIQDAGELLASLDGDGGSDFRPAFARLEADGFSGVVVAMTDGDIAVPCAKPERVREVVWLLQEGGAPPATWGVPLRREVGGGR
jgi:predicted metal-dependent peptidase